MKKLVFLVFILFSQISLAALPDIVALVNDKPITRHEFESRRKMIMLLNNIQNPPEHIQKQISAAAMQNLIDEEVLFQHSSKLGNRVSEEEINNAIKSVEEKNKLAPGQLSYMLKNNNIDINSFRSHMRGEIIKMHILSHISRSVFVSPKEIDATIFTTTDADAKISAKLFVSKDKEPSTLKQMYSLQKKIKGCESVKDSLYQSFANKIDIDTNLNSLNASIKSLAKDLKPGVASSVFEMEDGFKIMLVCNKEIIGLTNEDNNYLVNFLSNKKLSGQAQKIFNDMRKRAYIKVLINE